MEKQEIKIGDRVYIQQAWEDEQGNYHDEFADVVSIMGGFAKLKFDKPEIDEFLDGADFEIENLELVTNIK